MGTEEDFQYRDILKVEFRNMIEKFLEPRAEFHTYAIGRLCTHGTMLGFDYGYYTLEKANHIGMFIDLKQYGTIHFSINCITSYGKIVTPTSDAIIESFLLYYPAKSIISPSRVKK